MEFGDILRGIGGFAANELLGVDDFRRAYKAAQQGNYGKALKSFGAGAFELGSTVLPVARAGRLAATGLRAGQGARVLAPAARTALFADPASELAFRGVSRLAPGLVAARPGFTRLAAGLLIPGGIAERAAGTALFNAIGRGGAVPTTPYASTRPTMGATYSTSSAADTQAGTTASGAAGGSTGGAAGGAAGDTSGSTGPELPAGGIAANDPAFQAAIDAERAAADEELKNYINQLGLARVRGSVEEEAAIRAAERAAAGGAVDVAGAFGEAGLGFSPATLMAAIEQLRATAAEDRRRVLARRTGRQAEAAQAQGAAQRAYERTLRDISNRELAGRVGQTLNMIQPYLGGA